VYSLQSTVTYTTDFEAHHDEPTKKKEKRFTLKRIESTNNMAEWAVAIGSILEPVA
jgi:hypothetical protein